MQRRERKKPLNKKNLKKGTKASPSEHPAVPFQDFIEEASELIQSVNPDGSFYYVNRAWLETLGYTTEELSALSLFDVIAPESLAHCRELFQKILSGATAEKVETVFQSKGGRRITLEGNISSRLEDGKVVGTRGIFRDITDRKEAEKALLESEERFRSLVSNIPGTFYRCALDADWTMNFMSENILEISGFPPSDFIKNKIRTFASIIHRDDQAVVEDIVSHAIQQKKPYTIEYRIVCADGSIRWVYEKGQGILDHQGKAIWLDGAIFDITERKLAEEDLHISEERFRSMAASAQDAIISVDNDGIIYFWNLAAERTFGYSQEEALGKNMHTLLAPSKYAPEYEKAFTDWQGTGRGAVIGHTRELSALRKDGSEFPIELSLASVKIGEKWNAVGLVRDITERKLAEEDLRISEERFRSMAASAQDAIISVDNDGIIYFWNLAAERTFGYSQEEALGKNMHTLLAPSKYAPEYEKAFTDWQGTGRGAVIGHTRELSALRKDGSEFPIELSLASVKIGEKWNAVGLVRDITERKRTEEDLARARAKELEIGARIQRTLLLGKPPKKFPGLQIAALTIPSKRIDGDFYDFFAHSEKLIDLVVGDVMGKGVPAALLGAGAKGHLLESIADLVLKSRSLPEPKDIMQKLLAKMGKELISMESFITMNYTRLDLDARRIQFVDLGHTKTIHYMAELQKCLLHQGSNMPLGFSLDDRYKQVEVSIRPGDLLFYYSDGATEAQDPAGEFFGEKRLVECIQENAHLDCEKIIHKVLASLVHFSRSESFKDDLTCVAFKVSSDETLPPLFQAEMEFRNGLDDLEGIRNFIRGFCNPKTGHLLDEKDTRELELAVNESAANVIRHAYAGTHGNKIVVGVQAFSHRILVFLHHWGRGFEPPHDIQAPAVEAYPEGGFGLYLLKELTDGVSYSQDESGQNTIRIVKRRRGN